MLLGAMTHVGGEWDVWYPDDLPPEWRLDYYANEFRALFLPVSLWSVWGEEEWEELDWPDHLAVVVELTEGSLKDWNDHKSILEEHGLSVSAYVTSSERVVQRFDADVLLKLRNEAGWTAFGMGSAITCLTYEEFNLRKLRSFIESSGAWQTDQGVLFVDATPEQLRSINTLMELLA